MASTATSRFRGHDIELASNGWIFTDTGEPTADTWQQRPCGHCGRHNTPEGHDGCIGTLPGVMNACCGHGATNEAYIQFPDGTIIDGQAAMDEMEKRRT